MTLPPLTVAIATMADRLGQLDANTLPEMDGITYRIFVQNALDQISVIGATDRRDIKIIPIETTGVAHSRNAAIQSVPDGILLFADDDIVFDTSDYTALREMFAATPDLDFICGRLHSTAGADLKPYPPHLTKASRLNTGKIVTPEIAIRMSTIQTANVLFDPNFGAGRPLWLGDEYIFLCDALRAGLKGRHVNLVFGAHPHASSGKDNSPASFVVRDKVLRRALGSGSWPLRLAFAIKNRRRFPDWKTFWRFVQP